MVQSLVPLVDRRCPDVGISNITLRAKVGLEVYEHDGGGTLQAQTKLRLNSVLGFNIGDLMKN